MSAQNEDPNTLYYFIIQSNSHEVPADPTALPWQTSCVTEIRHACLNRNSESIIVRYAYQPFMYLIFNERDENGQFIEYMEDEIIGVYQSVQRYGGRLHGPTQYEICRKRDLYFYRENAESTYLKMWFPSHTSMRQTMSGMVNGQKKKNAERGLPFQDQISVFTFYNEHTDTMIITEAREADYFPDPLIKSNVEYKLDYAGWHCAKMVQPLKEVSTLDLEYKVDIATVKKVDESICNEWEITPKVLSFDLEVRSSNYKQFPSASKPDDMIFLIGASIKGKHINQSYAILVLDLNQVDESDIEKWHRKPTPYIPDGSSERPHVFDLNMSDIEIIHTRKALKKKKNEKKGENEKKNDEKDAAATKCELIVCNTETSCVYNFFKLVADTDPDILIGYNIQGFDNRYIAERSTQQFTIEYDNDKKTSKIPNIGSRFHGIFPKINDVSWESDAYGYMEIFNLVIEGRLCIDLLNVIKRNHKLAKYTLDFVSEHFLKKTKSPLEARDIFLAYDIATKRTDKRLIEQVDDVVELRRRKLHLVEEYDMYYASRTDSKRVKELLAKIEKRGNGENGGEPKKSPKLVNEVISIYNKDRMSRLLETIYYCVTDCVLPNQLFDRLNIFVDTIEMAKAADVRPEDIYIRGQQFRVVSKLYRTVYERGYVLHVVKLGDLDSYEGAYVFDAEPGIYFNVVTFDFASLYPNVIRYGNLSYDTLIPEGSDIPDDRCNVFDVEEKIYKKVGTRKIITGMRKQRIRYIKQTEHVGCLPVTITTLLDARAKAKVEMENASGIKKTILDRKQNALKVTANSMYGATGVSEDKGKLPCLPIARTVTFIGRQSIRKVQNLIDNAYKEDPTIPKMRVVYGDTDSCMAEIIGEFDVANMWKLGKRIEAYINSKLTPPLKVALENFFRIFEFFTPKRYAAEKYKKDGTIDPIIYSKGLLDARRDNANILVELFQTVQTNMMLHKKDDTVERLEQLFQNTLNIIDDYIGRMIHRRVDYSDLSIIKSVKGDYDSDTNPLAVFSEMMKNKGRPIAKSERVEYILQEEGLSQGEKMVTIEMYVENPESYKIDYHYYLEHYFSNHIDQLIAVGHRKLLDMNRHKWMRCVRLRDQREYVNEDEKKLSVITYSYVEKINDRIQLHNKMLVELKEVFSEIQRYKNKTQVLKNAVNINSACKMREKCAKAEILEMRLGRKLKRSENQLMMLAEMIKIPQIANALPYNDIISQAVYFGNIDLLKLFLQYAHLTKDINLYFKPVLNSIRQMEPQNSIRQRECISFLLDDEIVANLLDSGLFDAANATL